MKREKSKKELVLKNAIAIGKPFQRKEIMRLTDTHGFNCLKELVREGNLTYDSDLRQYSIPTEKPKKKK